MMEEMKKVKESLEMKQNCQTSRRLCLDIENDGLLLDTTKFHCAVTYDLDSKIFKEYRLHQLKELIVDLEKAAVLIGHNLLGHDLPVLKKLGGLDYKGKVVDTLIWAKLLYYDKDRSWSHSLDSYGERLGEKKMEYDKGWEVFTEEMLVYNKQDVIVTTKLYNHLKRKGTWLREDSEALELEQDVQRIVTKQYIKGWRFDEKKARKLHIELTQEKETAEERLWSTFTPKFLPDGKIKTPKRPFRRMGVSTVGPHQPIKLRTFNPGSGNHVVWWIESVLGKQNWILTDKGNPKTDSDTLQDMFKDEPFLEPLLHYLEVNKLLGQLAEGPKAWLKTVRGGRIHGEADILGTVTGRFTHSNPNLAQVPSVRAYKGEEARALFAVERGYKLVGADASGLELRTLSHYLSRYDGGEYGRQVLEEDIHTANQQAAGLPTRGDAKTFIYAFLYGAGDAKIGTITGGGSKEGAKLKSRFLKKTKGLGGLVSAVKEAAKKKWIRGLSGRRLQIRSPHSALNVLLQSAGAYYMKYWVVAVDKMIQEKGYDASIVGNIHDEIQVEVKEEQAENFSKNLESLFITVGDDIGMRIKMEGESKIGNNWYDTH